MIELIIKVAVSYLLGSISGSLLLGKFRDVDIRSQGSGNAGGTNALRTQGVWFALGVIVIDIGKGALAAGLVSNWDMFNSSANSLQLPWLAVSCGLAAVAGHIWPIFFSFRGGKGAGTVVGVLAVLAPLLMAGMIFIWLLVMIITGYVGLATIIAAAAVPLIMVLFGDSTVALLSFTVLIAALMLWTHRSNIQRLLQGTENRFERVRIKNWLR